MEAHKSANKTLVAYISKQGATEESAGRIVDILRGKFGLDVDVVDLKKGDPPSLGQYRNVVVGSGVRAGRVYGKAVEFLGCDFGEIQVAFFVSSAWAGTPGSYDDAKARFVDKTVAKHPKIRLVGTEAFGGRIRYIRKTMVDNTDISKVEAWAEQLGKIFTQ